ncbi:hypothetical protein UA08_01636 [Talaromyces atroroseus]|uniref:BHLH domain-containing protein n=1 Tax=Talaromyces atroroseus TaxID=1441469 RepID=A0A1Q5QA62_TALAT|nr:hypothetical protein UA08_01636 [Talaromyces atroroseus]OKL62659.1 hypothetical protein UA08_01636 [Talaromyces atroroseus]
MWAKIHKNRDHSRQTSGHAIFVEASRQPVLQSTSGNPLPPKAVLKDLPALPSDSDNTRMVSSIYSRDDSGVRFADGNMPTSPMRDYAEYSRYADDGPDISPPDSPVDMASAKRHSDVSPIESGGHFFAEVPKNKQSHLPVPRKHHRSSTLSIETDNQQARLSDNQGFEGVSHESTIAATSVTPQESRSGIADSKSKEGSKLLSAGKEKLQMFSKPRDQRPKQQQLREQWKGASGRFPLVPPIDTKSYTKHNKLSRPSAQRDTEANRHNYIGHNAYTITTVSAGNPMVEKPRSKTDQFRLRSRIASPAVKDTPRGPGQNADPITDERATNQSTLPLQGEIEIPKTAEEKPEELNISDMFHDLNMTQEPRSRFSASTYAPTEAATTPPGSSHADAPPVPSTDHHSPIMTRRRPIPSYAASIKSMKRKPVSTETPTWPDADMESLSPEQQSQRRVDSLETRRRQLSLRKDSIRTMLHELTEVIQPSSIAYDMATRDEVKKTVNSLKAELDDIGKEDHEIGLKLVRLYKNLNNAAEFEHSTLWVKRVTS